MEPWLHTSTLLCWLLQTYPTGNYVATIVVSGCLPLVQLLAQQRVCQAAGCYCSQVSAGAALWHAWWQREQPSRLVSGSVWWVYVLPACMVCVVTINCFVSSPACMVSSILRNRKIDCYPPCRCAYSNSTFCKKCPAGLLWPSVSVGVALRC